ncbi:hypothetical protein BH11ACT8_BH11ACT8_17420 [soil metagenome]
MVAEDDADVRDLIEMVLAQSGFTVILAPDGYAAIEAVREHDPILMTLDVNMPGIDGFATARRVREFSRAYLIMITSLTEEVDIIRGFEAGADDYLVKPFRPRELRARADAMLRREGYLGMHAPGEGSSPAVLAMPEPEPETWATIAARELREQSAPPARPAATNPSTYVGRRVRDAPSEPAAPPAPAPAPAQPVHQQPLYREPAPQQPVYQEPARQQPAQQAPAPVAAAPQVAAAGSVGDLMRFNGISAEGTTGRITLDGRALELAQPEAELLLSLLRTGRRVRSKADLVLAMRGQGHVTSHFVNEADKRAVDIHIANLRRKLGDDGPQARYIETVKGVGYRLAA